MSMVSETDSFIAELWRPFHHLLCGIQIGERCTCLPPTFEELYWDALEEIERLRGLDKPDESVVE